VTSQFEELDVSYVSLVNDAGRRSLWPVFADVPDDWRVVFGKAGREEYLSFIEESRRDMRPKSLIEAMRE
jgi:MbtH protein